MALFFATALARSVDFREALGTSGDSLAPLAAMGDSPVTSVDVEEFIRAQEHLGEGFEGHLLQELVG